MKAHFRAGVQQDDLPPNTVLRAAVRDDARELAHLEAIVFNPEVYPTICLRQYRYLLKSGNAKIIVAVVDSRIAGALVLLFRKNSDAARIYSIAVHPDHQGGTLGKAMFDQAEDVAGKCGCKRMLIEIRSDNHRHLKRYQARGYQLVATLEDYYPDHQSGLKLEKWLEHRVD